MNDYIDLIFDGFPCYNSIKSYIAEMTILNSKMRKLNEGIKL